VGIRAAAVLGRAAPASIRVNDAAGDATSFTLDLGVT
jgi:hypothetical protein